MFWDPRYRGKVGVYDSYREAIGMALLRDGVRDVNTSNPSALAAAGRALEEMARAVDVRLTTEGAYEGLPSGKFAVHQAWSGDILSALRWEERGRSAPLRIFGTGGRPTGLPWSAAISSLCAREARTLCSPTPS